MDVEGLREVLGARIAALVAERERFVVEANQRLGEYGGRIGELERVLEMLEKPTLDPSAHMEPQRS